MSTLKILLVEDHALVREMLQNRLQQEEDFEVVGAASNGEEALEIASHTEPDILMMDIDMPGMNCFEAARRIVSYRPTVRLVFLSAYTHDHYIEQALSVGALGFITKGEPPARIVNAIHEVAADRAFFSDQVRERIVFDAKETRLTPQSSKGKKLTARELEVLSYIARGHSKKEIALLLHVGVKTVDKHTENLMRKLGIHDRVELARYAIREGITQP